ncbi:uncharacterized protein AAES06_018413 [Glossophaga mutica]
MTILYNSSLQKATFFLTGFQGLEDLHGWISIPFCSIYLTVIVGNLTILHVIRTDVTLHEPMYYFLAMLALTDLGLCLSTLPTVLGIFWFDAREIGIPACFTQLFFIHTLSLVESSILLSMSIDRYIAICNPLRYSTVLTPARIVKMGLSSVLRSALLILPLPFLLKRFQYCRSHVLAHAYCLHLEIMKLACSSIIVNHIYGLFVVACTVGVDSLLIFLSYALILRTVLSIASRQERLRALNTCVSHMCAVLLFYIPMIGLSLVHRFGEHLPHIVHLLMSYVYLLVPPLMNPIVYSIKTKQIRQRIAKKFEFFKSLRSLDFVLTAASRQAFNTPFSPYTMTLGPLENNSSIASSFLLSGIPGLEHMHIWISIPLCFIYLVSILGNCTIVFIIKTEPSLHEPMYLFLSMLALTDLGLSLCTLPTVLGIFWIGARDISHDACFAQLFFIHCLSFLESSVLLSMAFDRFVAICHPLRYASILTNTVIGRIGLASLGRSVALIFPLPFMLRRFPYCGSLVLSHSYCLHQEVMKLACADIKANSIYGMFVIVSTVGIDSLLILFSYALILRTVLSIASKVERFKALNTCVSHICAVLLFYSPMIGLSIIHRFGKQAPHLVQVIMGFVYLLFPPLMNPIIYSVKTKQIRDRVTHVFC